MSDRTAAPADGSELPGDNDREFKSFEGQGYDPGHVVGPKKAELRAGLIRAAKKLPKGPERTAILAVVNGEDPGKEMRLKRAAEVQLREEVIRLAHSMPKGSDERRKLLATLVEAKGKVPPEFKEYQKEKNPKQKGSDADGDGKAGEKSPLEDDGKKAALVRLAQTMEKGSAERKAILLLADKCDKLPEGPMRDNCKGGPPKAKKDKDEGDKDKGKKKDDGKMPAELLEKFKKKKAKVKTDDECMKKYQDKDGSFKGGKGEAFKNCVKGFEECATGVTDAAGLCASIGREHGKMASESVKTAGTAAFRAARAQGESPEVALLAARVAMEIRRG